ncbi:hypothetical protein [Brenneria rubrifaciens]|uniref:Uncharacterized protein n=1 Tax=Brenneria rubrifaciens TaxID=55213 RepID=A0A4P8R2U4_9GAMM|nr:hypothetical protein [Brenneria rubrifaciens]QCR10014.1 hypothetical protein EH207_16830 [Brenneria rubrifaciens]
MNIIGPFKSYQAVDENPDLYIGYENAVGLVDEQIDCGTEIQGYIAIYADNNMRERVFSFPVLITKPENKDDSEEALLKEAIRAVCSDMVISY